MIIHTPVGDVSIGYISGELLCNLGCIEVEADPPVKLIEQLHGYFDGTFIGKFDVPLPSSTPFTSRCWEACRNIPYGSTISYAELASKVNSPKASRAAGQAMKRNPMPIITPCHRVVASTGKLHGFAGKTNPNSEELRRKRFLLDLEHRTIHQ